MKPRKAKPTSRAAQPAHARPVAYPELDTLRAMNDERAALGITLVEIAEGAAKTSRRKRGTCTISTVSKVFAGLTKSWNVVRTYQRLRDARLKSSREQGAA